jgi:hypothetical protein
VADTPQEATSTDGCPATKDSCPNSGVAQGFDGSSGGFLLLFWPYLVLLPVCPTLRTSDLLWDHRRIHFKPVQVLLLYMARAQFS